MKDKEEIGKLIASKRKELNITQQELAKKLNVTDKAISNWETGKNYPDYCYFNELKEILPFIRYFTALFIMSLYSFSDIFLQQTPIHLFI